MKPILISLILASGLSTTFAGNLENALIYSTVNSAVATSSMMIMRSNDYKNAQVVATPYGVAAVTDTPQSNNGNHDNQLPSPQEQQQQKIDFMND